MAVFNPTINGQWLIQGVKRTCLSKLMKNKCHQMASMAFRLYKIQFFDLAVWGSL